MKIVIDTDDLEVVYWTFIKNHVASRNQRSVDYGTPTPDLAAWELLGK